MLCCFSHQRGKCRNIKRKIEELYFLSAFSQVKNLNTSLTKWSKCHLHFLPRFLAVIWTTLQDRQVCITARSGPSRTKNTNPSRWKKRKWNIDWALYFAPLRRKFFPYDIRLHCVHPDSRCIMISFIKIVQGRCISFEF